MSYFLFGYLPQERLLQARAPDGFALITAAQPIIEQMAREQGATEADVAFLLARSADDDTSEDVISPFDVARMADSMTVVQAWVSDLPAPLPDLFLTEGYETDFVLIETWPEEFARALTAIAEREQGYWPSLRIRFRART